MKDELSGWDEIGAYLGVSCSTAQRNARFRGLPIHRRPGGGRKPPVFASKAELDKWKFANDDPPPAHDEGFAEQLLRRFSRLSAAKSLYRQNLSLCFTLRRVRTRVQARVETEYELVNGSSERQPYVQEVTVDDCEDGYVELMTISADGKPISFLNRPEPTEHRIGCASYQSPRLSIEPRSTGKAYSGKAVWIVNRSIIDFWYLHMGIPTLGARVETVAPPEFEITPSFFWTGLYLVSEHIDIAWKLRPHD